jgi:rhamnopyranosyl-N-acetylglucosaminyl-diphospho-decaprenol beta-1,3/1,4-galactofuranosyltransferase
MDKISCVIVTYNRKELLKECIQAVINQTYKVDTIYIIDNNSTDGTQLLFDEGSKFNIDNIKYIKLNENLGGAGGFFRGMKEVNYDNTDWVWIMDDDTIPTSTALEKLIESNDKLKNEKVSFLCSKVVDQDYMEMNIPCISERVGKNGYKLWAKYIGETIIEVSAATFVSVLINTKAICVVGLPWKNFFIWGDDTEYTMRLNRDFGPGFLVGSSLVIHKRFGGQNIDILKETNINRINLYKYKYRNDLIIAKEYKGNKYLLILILKDLKDIIKCLQKRDESKYLKIITIFKGIKQFLFDCKAKREFKNRKILS